MPRPPQSLVSQAQSRTAVVGFVAAGRAGVDIRREKVVEWFERNGIRVREAGLRDALKLRLRRYGDPPSTAADPSEHDWIRESVEVDPTKLDLDLAIVIFPAMSRSEQLLAALRGTGRVVRLYSGYEKDLVAVIVYDGARERRRLQTRLEEHAPELHWIVVRDVDDAIASESWLSLARKIAAEEGL